MNGTPDLVTEIYYLLKRAFRRVEDDELIAMVREKHPGASASDIMDAAKTADQLRRLASGNYYAPSASAAGEEAVKLVKEQLPGLSDAAYNAAMHQAMYDWMK
jgi:hypothetical protein